jgi:hypothetical protein
VFALLLAAAAAAPAYAEWREADTPHFRFIFEPRDRGSVDELLTFSEDVYAQVTAFWGSYPDKVPCIIRGRRDDANGITRSFPFRIDLYVTAPTDFVLGTRASSWLRLLLTHELTHYVHETMGTGILHRVSAVFGGELTSAGLGLLPGWAIEGPAVYDETRFTEGGRGRSALFEVYLKAAAQEDRFFSLAQAGYPSDFPPPDRIYVGGYALSSWLQERYGQETLRRIMAAYLEFPFLGPWSAIAKVTGRSADAVYADMLAELKRRYADARAISGGKRLTPGIIGSWTHPRATTRGLVAYHRGPDLFPSIVMVDPKTGRETVLARAVLTDDSSFTATRDARTVWWSSLVVDFRRAADERTVSDLFVLDTASSSVRRVTWDAHLWHPAAAADGRRLLAVQGAGPYSRLVSVDPESGSLRVLFSLAEATVYNPVLSPDGSRVAFILNVRGMQGLYAADLDSLDRGSSRLADPDAPVADVNAGIPRAALGPEPFGDYFPSFVDDHRVLLGSDRSGAVSLYLADLDTGEIFLVQQDPVAAISAAVENGTLTYTSYTTQGYCLKQAALPAAPQVVRLEAPANAPPFPAPVPWTGASVKEAAYRDLPLLLLWLPDLVLRQTGPAASNISLGVGAWVGGASLLGASEWEVQAAWLPGPSQPFAGATLGVDIDALHLQASSRLDYGYSSEWTESVDNGLTAEYALIGDAVRDSARLLTVGAGVRHHSELTQAVPFTFAGSLAAPISAWFTTLALPATIRWQWSAGAAGMDLVPRPAIDTWLQATTFLPAFSLSSTQEEVDLFGQLRLPSPIAHQSVSLGVKAAHYIGAPYSTYTDGFTTPRGFGTRTRTSPGGFLASIDYFAPLLLDQPLLLGWAMTAAALAIHAEGVADDDIGALAVSVVPAVFAGVEVTARFAYGEFEFPAGLGFAARLRTTAPRTFDPSTDVGLYLFAGFDGFSAGSRASGASGYSASAQRGR